MAGCPSPFGSSLPLVPDSVLLTPTLENAEWDGDFLYMDMVFPQAMNVAILPATSDLKYTGGGHILQNTNNRVWTNSTRLAMSVSAMTFSPLTVKLNYMALAGQLQTADGRNYPAFETAQVGVTDSS